MEGYNLTVNINFKIVISVAVNYFYKQYFFFYMLWNSHQSMFNYIYKVNLNPTRYNLRVFRRFFAFHVTAKMHCNII